MNKKLEGLSLLDYIGWRMGCVYLSDLHGISNVQKICLAREIEKLSISDASLQEWNDALEYLVGCSPSVTPEDARVRLIKALDPYIKL